MSKTRPASFITDDADKNESLLIHDIARMFKKNFDRRVRSLGLTRTQWLTLGMLRRNPGISQAQLADRLDIEPISAARNIDRLERAGWVERRADPKDRRVKRLYLTSRAQEVVGRMRALALDMRRDVLESINQQEHAQLIDILGRIKHNLCEQIKAGT